MGSLMVKICLVVTLVMVLAPASSFASNTTKPLTSPPPIVFQPMSLFIGHTYLESGTVSILDNLNQTAKITATTYSTATVQTVGAIFQLQRWTGTDWIDVGAATSQSASNNFSFYGTSTKTITTGYYYRAKTTHFIHDVGLTEQDYLYSPAILAN
jgi:hypothetical protein